MRELHGLMVFSYENLQTGCWSRTYYQKHELINRRIIYKSKSFLSNWMSSFKYLTVRQDQEINDSLKPEVKTNGQTIEKQEKLRFFDYLIGHISQTLTIILLFYLIYLIANLFICRGLYLNTNSDSNGLERKCMNIVSSNLASELTASQKVTHNNQFIDSNSKKQQKNKQQTFILETAAMRQRTSTAQIGNKRNDLSVDSEKDNIKQQSFIKNSLPTNSQQNQQKKTTNNNKENLQKEGVAYQKNKIISTKFKQKYQQFAAELELDDELLVNSWNQQNYQPTLEQNQKQTLKFLTQDEREKIVLNYIESSEDSQSIYLQFLGENQKINNKIYSPDSGISNSNYKETNTFCVIVSTFNNAQSQQVTRTMNSIFNQDYTKYHTIVVDKSSTDDTVKLLNDFVNQSPILLKNTRIIQNQQNSQLKAIIEGLNYCKKGQIAILMNGNSQFLSKKVFKMTDSLYQNENTKILYSDAFSLDINNKVIQQIKGSQYNQQQKTLNIYRDVASKYGKYFTFNTNLLTSLKHSYLVDNNGKWLKYSENEALIISLLELSCGKISYLNEPVILNQFTSDQSEDQKHGLALQKNIIASKIKLNKCRNDIF